MAEYVTNRGKYLLSHAGMNGRDLRMLVITGSVAGLTESVVQDLNTVADLDTPASVTLAAQALTPTPGAVTVALTPAAATLTAQALTATPGAMTVVLTPASVSLAAQPLTAAPGPVTVALTPAVMTVTAQPFSTGQDVFTSILVGIPRGRWHIGSPSGTWHVGRPRGA